MIFAAFKKHENQVFRNLIFTIFKGSKNHVKVYVAKLQKSCKFLQQILYVKILCVTWALLLLINISRLIVKFFCSSRSSKKQTKVHFCWMSGRIQSRHCIELHFRRSEMDGCSAKNRPRNDWSRVATSCLCKHRILISVFLST